MLLEETQTRFKRCWPNELETGERETVGMNVWMWVKEEEEIKMVEQREKSQKSATSQQKEYNCLELKERETDTETNSKR
jgi:hypothetical protein